MAAVDECGAPMVSIPGGEPLMHSRIGEIVAGLIKRKKYIYLCTNALLLKQRLEEGVLNQRQFLHDQRAHGRRRRGPRFRGLPRGHLQGGRRSHQHLQLAVSKGFRVTTNSTLFKHCDSERMRKFFDHGSWRRGHDDFSRLQLSKGARPGEFPARARQHHNVATRISQEGTKRWQFNLSPLFVEFLQGKRHLECTPWGCPPIRCLAGSAPCYLDPGRLHENVQRTFDDDEVGKTPVAPRAIQNARVAWCTAATSPAR